MTHELVVRGGSIVTPTGLARRDVGIDGGVIRELADELPGGRDEIDARGLLVLPGVVDAHVHLNDPGRSDWEGIGPGTAALAAGGATTAVDMPLNAHPPTIDAAAFDLKAARVAGSAHVDLALWGGLVPGNVDRLDELAERGVVGFKAFMCGSGIDDFAAADDVTLWDGMREAARLGLPVAVHAESDALTTALAARAVAGGRTSMRDFMASRPVVAELEAIARALLLAEDAGCALHVVHVSSGRGVALVAEARARGVDASCETCPHYLVLTDADAERLGRGRQVRAAAAAARRARGALVGARGRRPADDRARTTRRRRPRSSSRRARSRPGAASRAPRRCCRSCSTRPRAAECSSARAGRRDLGLSRAPPPTRRQGQPRAGLRRRHRARPARGAVDARRAAICARATR